MLRPSRTLASTSASASASTRIAPAPAARPITQAADASAPIQAPAPVERHTARPAGLAALAALLLALVAALALPLQARALDDPAIEAAAVLLADPDTGAVLYERNADETRYPASLTKIMTALVVLEHVDDLNQTVTAEEADFAALTPDSSVAGFLPGETLTIEQLLYGLLLPSGNDASYILARAVGGSVDAFVELMNEKAADLGCTGTHFANPCGLHDPNHYTCARDLYRMVCAAMGHEEFARIVQTSLYSMPATNLQPARSFYNSNYLLNSSSSAYYAPARGVKTGNTSEAGRCLAGAAEQDGITLYSIVLGCADGAAGEAPMSITETRRLFEWAYANWSMTDVAAAGDTLGSEPVTDAFNDQQVGLEAGQGLQQLLPNDADLDAVEVSYELDATPTAPIAAGDALGTATYRLGETVLGTVPVVAGNEVALAPLALVRNIALDLVQNPVFWVVVGIVVLVLIIAGIASRRAAAKRRSAQTKRLRAVRGTGSGKQGARAGKGATRGAQGKQASRGAAQGKQTDRTASPAARSAHGSSAAPTGSTPAKPSSGRHFRS